MVWELRLPRMVEILFTKKSQNLCGRSADGTEDGRDEVFDLPRRVFVMLNNRLDEAHARILVLKNVDFCLLHDLADEFASGTENLLVHLQTGL